MTKITLTAAALLIATGTAFAGSDNYHSRNAYQGSTAPATSVDKTFTASIRKPVTVRHQAANLGATTQSDTNEYGQGIWGH